VIYFLLREENTHFVVSKGVRQMNKKEMVDKLALETGVTKKEAAQFLDAFVDVVSNELSNSGNVRLVGFGTFMVKNTVERNGVDPRTKKPIKIPARKVPKFTAGKDLKLRVK